MLNTYARYKTYNRQVWVIRGFVDDYVVYCRLIHKQWHYGIIQQNHFETLIALGVFKEVT